MTYKKKAELPGSFGRQPRKAQISLELALVGFAYDNNPVDFSAVQQVMDDIKQMVASKSNGLVTIQQGPCTIRDCELLQIEPESDDF